MMISYDAQQQQTIRFLTFLLYPSFALLNDKRTKAGTLTWKKEGVNMKYLSTKTSPHLYIKTTSGSQTLGRGYKCTRHDLTERSGSTKESIC